MARVEMDGIDQKILRSLMKNARMPYLEIARECGISGAAIHQRVRKLTDLGVIQGAHLVVDPQSLGLNVCAIIGIQLQDSTLNNSTVDTLRKIPEVVECYYITGKYNILIKVYCRDNEHLMHTILDGILKVSGITTTETFISLCEAFKRQVFVDDGQERAIKNGK